MDVNIMFNANTCFSFGVLILVSLSTAATQKNSSPISTIDTDAKWYIINDGVMGGLSRSNMENHSEFMRFSGVVSLENNGGFASTRMQLTQMLPSDAQALSLRVRGDGKTYQLRIRTDGYYDGISYRYKFKTTPDQWLQINAPFSDFRAVFRGRFVKGAPQLSAQDIAQMGFLISDKQQGQFALDIADIQAID